MIEKQARLLAKENKRSDPEIIKIYWFPDDNEVRLIGLHSAVPANNDQQICPFFFRSSPSDNLPVPSRIALIRPDEFGTLELPPNWGDWNTAVELENEEGSGGSKSMLDKMVDFLNHILLQDREGVSNFFLERSMPASQELIDHPTIRVTMQNEVRMIGMLNGLLIDEASNLCLRMVISDESGLIEWFEVGEYR